MIERFRHPGPAAALTATLLLAACGRGEPALTIESAEGPVAVSIEVADEPRERERGLMGREELPADAGMVFLHAEPTPGRFWMKDTLIPLSLAVWGKDGRIAALLDMTPCRVQRCPIYDPGVAWVGALEVNKGFFEEQGVEIGDRVRLEGAGSG